MKKLLLLILLFVGLYVAQSVTAKPVHAGFCNGGNFSGCNAVTYCHYPNGQSCSCADPDPNCIHETGCDPNCTPMDPSCGDACDSGECSSMNSMFECQPARNPNPANCSWDPNGTPNPICITDTPAPTPNYDPIYQYRTNDPNTSVYSHIVPGTGGHVRSGSSASNTRENPAYWNALNDNGQGYTVSVDNVAGYSVTYVVCRWQNNTCNSPRSGVGASTTISGSDFSTGNVHVTFTYNSGPTPTNTPIPTNTPTPTPVTPQPTLTCGNYNQTNNTFSPLASWSPTNQARQVQIRNYNNQGQYFLNAWWYTPAQSAQVNNGTWIQARNTIDGSNWSSWTAPIQCYTQTYNVTLSCSNYNGSTYRVIMNWSPNFYACETIIRNQAGTEYAHYSDPDCADDLGSPVEASSVPSGMAVYGRLRQGQVWFNSPYITCAPSPTPTNSPTPSPTRPPVTNTPTPTGIPHPTLTCGAYDPSTNTIAVNVSWPNQATQNIWLQMYQFAGGGGNWSFNAWVGPGPITVSSQNNQGQVPEVPPGQTIYNNISYDGVRFAGEAGPITCTIPAGTPTNTPTLPPKITPTDTPTPTAGPWVKLKNASFQSQGSLNMSIPAVPAQYDPDDPGNARFIDEGSGGVLGVSTGRELAVLPGGSTPTNTPTPTPGKIIIDVPTNTPTPTPTVGVVLIIPPVATPTPSFYKGGAICVPSTNIAPVNQSASQWTATGYNTSGVLRRADFIDYIKARKGFKDLTNFADITQNGVYYWSTGGGDSPQPSSIDGIITTLNDPSNTATSVVVIFDFPVVINGPTFVTNKSVAIIAPQITLDPNVTNIRAVLITDTLNTGTNVNLGVKIVGNLVATNLNNGRQQQSTGNAKPSMFIVFEPKIYVDLLPYLSKSIYEWTQLQ